MSIPIGRYPPHPMDRTATAAPGERASIAAVGTAVAQVSTRQHPAPEHVHELACRCGLRLLGPAHALAPSAASLAVRSLSARELDVLMRYARGDDTQQLADDLGISIQTVKNHLWAVRRKLNVPTTRAAIWVAMHGEA